MRKLLLLLCWTVPGFGIEYSIVTDVTATTNVVTIQAQATTMGSTAVNGQSVYVRCVTTACDVTIERNGTAATTTAGTLNAVKDTNFIPGAAPKARVFTASNVGAGTVLSKDVIPAGGSQVFDLAPMMFTGNGTGKNFTVRVTPTASARTVVSMIIDERTAPLR